MYFVVYEECILVYEECIFFSIFFTATPEPSPFDLLCHYMFIYESLSTSNIFFHSRLDEVILEYLNIDHG